MYSDKKIWTIIVTYNGLHWLGKCIGSLTKSSVPTRIIVVDNASTDGTPDYISHNYPEVSLINSEVNHGFGKANNIGISEALNNGADYVFLLNQDACVEEDTIVNLISASEENPEFGIISPVHLDENGNRLDLNFSVYVAEDKCPGFLSDLYFKKHEQKVYALPFVNAAAWLLPRKTFERAGGFNELFFMYGEDDELCSRIIYHGMSVGVFKGAQIFHSRDNHYFKKRSFSDDLRKKILLQNARNLNVFFDYKQKDPARKILRWRLPIFIKSILKLKIIDAYVTLNGLFSFLLDYSKWRKLRVKCEKEFPHFLNLKSNNPTLKASCDQ